MKKLALISFLAPLAAFAEEVAAPVADLSVGHGLDVFGISASVAMSALAIGFIGFGMTSAIGRNPSAAADIKAGALLPMVLAEGLGIIAVILSFVK